MLVTIGSLYNKNDLPWSSKDWCYLISCTSVMYILYNNYMVVFLTSNRIPVIWSHITFFND